jgi:phage-related minor tail protein
VVEETIKKLADIEDITQRNQLAFKIFGRSASELAPLLSLGSAGIEEATQKAEKLGLVLSKDALEAANAFRVEFDFLKSSFGAIANEIGVAFLPVAKELVNIIQNNVIPVIKAITGFFNGLSDSTKKTIAIIAGLVAAIGPLLAGLGFFVTTILPALKVGLIAVSALFSPLALKIIAITAAVVGLGLGVKGLIDSWDTVTEFFSQLWDKVKLLFINGVKNTLIAFQKFTSIIGFEFQDTIDSLEENAKEPSVLNCRRVQRAK